MCNGNDIVCNGNDMVCNGNDRVLADTAQYVMRTTNCNILKSLSVFNVLVVMIDVTCLY